ncbi:ROK family protein [Pinirhizobacter sp.]|jgi:polyphosphate glucokinase|uniref:ROK family protein n=1 Tax=Pinirhizobacter sp. TaxID=2950432 RepID=UPI002F414974
MKKQQAGILSIDVGGSHVKADVLDAKGKSLAERVRVPTPRPCPPDVLVSLVKEMVTGLPPFDRISIGFPGVICRGKVMTAVNLGNDVWVGYPLERALGQALGDHPAKLINDADMQGFGLIKGKGLEFVVTLGTGMGTGLFLDGELMPHMELAHHPLKNGKTYEQLLGNAAYEDAGKKKWNKRLHKALCMMNRLLNPDHIYLGGGNADYVDPDCLPENVSVGDNKAGIVGGAALWRNEPKARAPVSSRKAAKKTARKTARKR